ncbi:MAG: type II toxin-antitoxin system RelE/ParE family toxin [Archangium sp.]|nr:type II toxin-antitoxin system RelE/ParE family toxin [Archangium sp.]
MKLKVTVLAREDLRHIAAFTEDRWGERQAERYIRLLDAHLRALSDRPTPGKRCDDVKPGLRRISVGRHVIFFRVGKTVITVLRVLHDQMLPRLHL